jgi:alpha-tubulin suppressor-like RCC1 family protein
MRSPLICLVLAAVPTTVLVFACVGDSPVSPQVDASLADTGLADAGVVDLPTQVAAGSQHGCALLTSKRVACWGATEFGQIGKLTATACEGRCDAVPSVVPQLAEVSRVISNYWHSCAILKDGSLQCWGKNDAGQLGPGAGDAPFSATAVKAPLTGKVLDVAVSEVNTCAIVETAAPPVRQVYCWGTNELGVLGSSAPLADGPARDPVLVVGTSGASQIALAGRGHACAIIADNVVC